MDFRNDRHYCLLCPLHPEAEEGRFVTAAGVRIHLSNDAAHGGHSVADPQPGKHYVMGFRAQQIYAARQFRAEEEGDELACYFGIVGDEYTAEDFLTDFRPGKVA